MLDPNCYRWIVSSINKYFYDNRGTLNVIVEDQDWEDRTAYTIVRTGEPKFIETTKGDWYVSLTVNLLIYTPNSATDLYVHKEQVGMAQALMRNIGIYKYGDDDSYYFCLIANRTTNILPFGMPDSALKADQTVVENKYNGTFEE